MTLKEFLEKNPAAVEEAAKCKDLNEFKSLTEKAGITFDSPEKLEKAFALVKNQKVTELSEDALDAVSGGSRLYDAKNVYINREKGTVQTIGTGKKA